MPSIPTTLALAVLLAATAAAEAGPLDPWRWERRVLVVAAPNADDADLRVQRTLLAEDPQGLAGRDVLVVEVTGDGADRGLDAGALRSDLGLPNDAFAVRLVGKDGGVKLRADAPVPLAELYGLIDSMPMRQDEMRRG